MPENNQKTTHDVARSIRKWAVDRGLLLPMPSEAEVTAAVEPIRGSLEVESLLRQKELLSIAFNESSRTIYLYTKRKVTGKDLKTLPGNIMQCGIAYPQGIVDDIGKNTHVAHGAASFIHNGRGANRYACGSSISPGNSASAGTLGALVSDQNMKLFGLSNNHVTGLCNHSQVGVPILAPGVIDVHAGGIHPFTLGFHHAVRCKSPPMQQPSLATELRLMVTGTARESAAS